MTVFPRLPHPLKYSIGLELAQRRSATLVFQGIHQEQQLMLCNITQKGIPPHPAETPPTRLKSDKVAKSTTWFSYKAKLPCMKFPCFSKALTREHDHHRSNATASADLETEETKTFLQTGSVSALLPTP